MRRDARSSTNPRYRNPSHVEMYEMSPQPGHIGRLGGEVAVHQIRDQMVPVADGRGAPLLRDVTHNVVDPH